MLHLLKKTGGEKFRRRIYTELCIVAGEAEFWDPARGGGIFLHHHNAIHNCKDKSYRYVKIGKTEENCGEYQHWKAVR